ncbi:Crp/Fnr family transcriptional regulator [Acidisoma silvae]|uniref:Crp/Fnr family transcriptional regulator n=1 Tax=Acidisoma silvae TaxID=2802396 RepID=A0A964E145_9PROT|nr:Crp/Fnr family transcriptional regulator [Acidisoma silvae]MCB8877398.1 Crp/Fnr family transcriptional regulator [Acidisoma silvae]
MDKDNDLTIRQPVAAKPKIPPPSIFAKPFARSTDPGVVQLLTEDEQAALIAISRVVEFRRHTVIYPEGGRSRFVYNVISGVAETYCLLPDGERRVSSFLFPSDLLGLSENGEYVATAQALTPLTAYKMPFEDLARLVRRDPDLDVVFLCKLCHELRQAERHTVTAIHNDARARVAGFILWLWRSEVTALTDDTTVTLPMLRHDIADYLGLSTEAISRALHQLETGGLIQRRGPRALQLLNIQELRRAAREI